MTTTNLNRGKNLRLLLLLSIVALSSGQQLDKVRQQTNPDQIRALKLGAREQVQVGPADRKLADAGLSGRDDISMIDETLGETENHVGAQRTATAPKTQRADRSGQINKRQATPSGAGSHSLKCRVEKDFFLDLPEFGHYSCANCYDNVPSYMFWQKLEFKRETRIWLHDELSGLRVLPNQTDIVAATFKSEATVKMWLACCAEAVECCKANAQYLPQTTDSRGNLLDDNSRDSCPATWDGFSCWPATKADSLAKQACPVHVYVLHDFKPACVGTVQKRCFANGSWYIRNQHEWSDYKDCRPEPIYATRMRLGGIWHMVSAMFMCPALIILSRVPNRHKSKRVKIMSNILLYLLINSICNAVYKFGVINKIFSPGIDNSAQVEQEDTISFQTWPGLSQLVASAAANNNSTNINPSYSYNEISASGRHARSSAENLQQALLHEERLRRSADQTSGSSLVALRRQGRQTSPLVIIMCWFISNLIRITRSLSYSWMFTGAVYLCSILHFAPAEPPASYIKTLMILTNALPFGIGLAYLIIRTIYEPSPLNLLIKLPYYYFVSDTEKVDYLWKSELSCWILHSPNDFIELIVEIPNYIFVVLNFGLFMATLFIMCNISRPGSTRNDMSIRDYIRAAGTLVLLYGLHAGLLSMIPSTENRGCLIVQSAYYAFVFVDGLQGVAVSYLFCYRTSEGKEVIHKWWLSLRGYGTWRKVSCNPDAALKRRSKGSINGNHNGGSDHHTFKYNHSTRSNNSGCCNGREVTTELIDIDESPVLDRHQISSGQREIL